MPLRYWSPSAFFLSSWVESMWVGFFGICGAGVTGVITELVVIETLFEITELVVIETLGENSALTLIDGTVSLKFDKSLSLRKSDMLIVFTSTFVVSDERGLTLPTLSTLCRRLTGPSDRKGWDSRGAMKAPTPNAKCMAWI